MIGSANAAWVPCSLIGWSATASANISINGFISNVDATDFYIVWKCPLPTVKGALKLYVSGTQLELFDADGTNFITVTYVEFYNDGAQNRVDTDPTNKNSAGLHQDTFAALDASGNDSINVRAVCEVADANALDVVGMSLRCYYAA